MIHATVRYLSWVGLFLVCWACTSETPTDQPDEIPTKVDQDFTVKVYLKSDPGDLNALITTNGYANTVLDQNVHASLLEIDHNTYADYLPYLATKRPVSETLEDGRIAIHYELRPEAQWSNGTPITGEDVAFTLKAIITPQVHAAPLRTFFEFIEDFTINPDNPKKFTFICQPYHLSEAATGTMPIFPAYFYDAQGLLSEFKVSDFRDVKQTDDLLKNPRLKDFADDFNKNYSKEATQIVGAGPYNVTEIEANQYVRLERKKEWWGDQVDGPLIHAYPSVLLFRPIPDDNSATTILKEQEIDVMTQITEGKYLELKENELINQNFHLYTPPGFSYRYIGINMKRPQLSDVRVRKALAHLVDKDYITSELSSGLSIAVNSPVSPLKPHYNKNIPQKTLDIEKAQQLLQEAGWADSDGDNILDKVIDGKKTSLSLRYYYANGNQFYKDVATIFKDEATRVGIEIVLTPLDFNVMIERMQERDFDLYSLAWGQGPTLDDFKQIWHTDADSPNGNNMVGFGNEETDRLIEEIRTMTDDKDGKRTELYLKFQEMVDAEQPCIFLVAPKTCTAIHKRFKNAPALSMRPGHIIRLFQLDPNYQK